MRNRKLKKIAKKLKHIFIASFEVKMGWEQPRKREKKTIVSINSYLIRDRKFKTNSKKIQKIKKHRYGFFSSQNGQGEAEKERKKNYRSDQFLPDQEQKINKKIAKKFKKLKNIIVASFQAKMGGERPRKRKKKIIVPINSYRTRNRKLKKIAKKFKKLKNIRMVLFKPKRVRRDQERKKNYRSDQFQPEQEFKITKKFKK